MKLREKMPALVGETTWLNGKVTNEELEKSGKATLIHFWSVSCGLCKEAMPDVNEFRDEYEDKLNVIAVHMPRSEKDLDIAVIEAMALGHDISQPTFVDNDHKLTDAFDNKYVPAYYVFDEGGVLRHFQAGATGMDMLRKRVNRVIGEEN